MSVTFPWCDECKNLISDEHTYKCKAFPNGIPDEFLLDKNIKDKSECANGIKYEKN